MIDSGNQRRGGHGMKRERAVERLGLTLCQVEPMGAWYRAADPIGLVPQHRCHASTHQTLLIKRDW